MPYGTATADGSHSRGALSFQRYASTYHQGAMVSNPRASMAKILH